MNLLQKLGEKKVGKKTKMKAGFTLNYNPFIFGRKDFMGYMKGFKCNVWELSGQEILKNGEEYESDYTNKFFTMYGAAQVKTQG